MPMDFLFDGPWTILGVGIVLEAVLGLMLVRTGRGRLLVAMIGVAAVLAIGLFAERWVVTDRESIEQTLDAAAAAVAANNLDGLLACVAPKAEKTRKDARMVLSLVEFRAGRIGGLEVTLNRHTSPPSARATFTAIGQGRYRGAEAFDSGFAYTVHATMRREGDRWLVGDYTVDNSPLPH